ncbi:STAS domain-containing protein [Bacillus mangrovi]|uniref:STAS domain-containing protein n=1 Tax=Metabacillus mangrovi TaxID=1491830 RepID=A0A7X2V5E2_9BACI|nr:STAS domain-containing protein [Metabacillus mangrovi]MTH53953.1 STAS domain-containing protein [Metabacillus mangrovi]
MEKELTSSIDHQVIVGGLEFSWDLDQGIFKYEKDDAVLFWIDSAMKILFDTIEEISGDKAAAVVLETAGFRQGIVVGDYFKSQNLTLNEVAAVLPNTYASAGWGRMEITQVNNSRKSAVIQVKDSWEHKINESQGKKTQGTFTPGHFAGILTGLFGVNIWYNVLQSQIEGHPYSEFEYFPSNMTVQQNIHEYARQEQSEQIRKLELLVEERTQELNELIREISSPIIPVLEGIVVVPLIGKYDEQRSHDLVQRTLTNLPSQKAQYMVLDLTAMSEDITRDTVEFIEQLAKSAGLIGVKTILVGITPEFAISIAKSGHNLSAFSCFSTLQHGIYSALSEQGRQII